MTFAACTDAAVSRITIVAFHPQTAVLLLQSSHLLIGRRELSITGKGVKVTRAGTYHEFFEADTVILALGMISIDDVATNIEGKIPAVFKIGDADKPAGFTEAIESGFKIGFQI